MKKQQGWNISLKTVRTPLIMLLIFIGIGVWRTLATGGTFYLFNFGYIGTAIAVGGFLDNALPRKHILWVRRISQILVASYMLGYLGFVRRENMQIEGFFFYLLLGVFAAATLHYFVAKVVGPLFLNRGWCGWACWTCFPGSSLETGACAAWALCAIYILPSRWGWFSWSGLGQTAPRPTPSNL